MTPSKTILCKIVKFIFLLKNVYEIIIKSHSNSMFYCFIYLLMVIVNVGLNGCIDTGLDVEQRLTATFR